MGGQGATRGQGERKGGTSVKPPASKDDGREIGTTTLHCTLAVRRREFLFLAFFSSFRRWYLWPSLTHTLADLDTQPRPRERLLDAVVGYPVGQARELQRARFRRVKTCPRVQIRALGEVGAAYDGRILVVKRGDSLMRHIMTVRTSETSSAMSCGARENSFSPAHVTVKFLCCATPPDAAALFG